jgi:hypothetical protein
MSLAPVAITWSALLIDANKGKSLVVCDPLLAWLLTDAGTTMSPRLLDDKNLARGKRKNELQSFSDAQTRAVNLQSILRMPLFRQCYFFAHLISVHNKRWFSITYP